MSPNTLHHVLVCLILGHIVIKKGFLLHWEDLCCDFAKNQPFLVNGHYLGIQNCAPARSRARAGYLGEFRSDRSEIWRVIRGRTKLFIRNPFFIFQKNAIFAKLWLFEYFAKIQKTLKSVINSQKIPMKLIFAKFFVSQKFRHLQCMRIYKISDLPLALFSKSKLCAPTRARNLHDKQSYEVAYVPVTLPTTYR